MADVIDAAVVAGHRALADTFADGGPRNLIDGRWRVPTGADSEEQFDPSRGATIGWLCYSSAADVDDAVAAAAHAQLEWSRRPLDARIGPLTSLAEAIDARRSSLRALIAIEVGKTLREAEEEIDLTLALIRTVGDADRWGRSRRSPLGVAGGISLYHYPLLSPLWMALPALTAGNGYVLRPCTWSPVTGVAAAELVDLAGYPTGLFNAVHGSLDTVNHILGHRGLSAVSYVGSGPWAQYMVDVGTRHRKRVDALGALRHLHIVTDDADPASAAAAVCESAIGVAGQRWLAGCTVVTAPGVAPAFIEALCEAAAAVRVGVSTDPATNMGPVVQRFRQVELLDRVRELDGEVKVLVDGSGHADGGGYFFGPTVLDGVPAGHPLLVEQVPGPIMSIACDGSAGIVHRDAHGTVTTVHDGVPRAATSAWFGSLPRTWDHAVQFFTA